MRIHVAALALFLPAVASATPYDKLFEVGTTMVYDETQTTKFGDQPPITKAGKVTCRVASVTTIARHQVSSVECDTDYSPVAALYMATKRGIYHLTDDSADGVKRTLRYERPFMPARPTKRVRDTMDANGMGERTVIAKQNGRWCAAHESSDPNAGGTTTWCFANGVIVEITRNGMWYGEGGGETQSKSVLVP
jgi:hypothetical protein